MYFALKNRYLNNEFGDNQQYYNHFEQSNYPYFYPAPSQQVALFDIILASNFGTIPSFTTTPYQIYGSNASRKDEMGVESSVKSYVVKNKRKALSSLKKKILMERFRKLLEKLSLEKLEEISDPGNLCCVHLYDFVTPDDIGEEEERKEIGADVKGLLHSFGKITSIKIFRPRVYCSNSPCYVAVTFSQPNAARKAVTSINGLVLGGIPIRARLAASDTTSQSSSDAASSVVVKEQSPEPPLRGGERSSSVLCLQRMVNPSDVIDPDEAAEVLSDLYSLCSAFGTIASIWIQKQPASLTAAKAQTEPRDLREHPWGLIEYSDLEDALEAISRLDGRVVSGETISASLFDYSAYKSGDFHDRQIVEWTATRASTGQKDLLAVRLCGFVDAMQLDEEDEMEEIFCDIEQIFSEKVPCLCVSSILILGAENATAASSFDALVVLPTLRDCLTLCRFLGNQVIGGEPLVVDIEIVRTVGQIGSSDHGPQVWKEGSILLARHRSLPISLSRELNPGEIIRSRRLHTSSNEGAVVLVRNYFLAEDLSEAKGKSEDLAALRRDLLQLSRSDASPASPQTPPLRKEIGIVRRVSIVDGLNIDGWLSKSSSEEGELIACIEYADNAGAEEALVSLDGIVVGGTAVAAYRQKYNSSDKSCRKVEAAPNTETTAEESAAMLKRSFAPPSQAMDEAPVTFDCVYESLEDADGEAEPSRPSSKYLEAKNAPRAPSHETILASIPVATAEVDLWIKDLLTKLSTLQKQAKEFSPLEAKPKQYFLAGIKQTTNAVKAGMVKMIFLAPNTEALEALDDKIDVLLSEAHSRNIPICYCLNKRKLGKAAQLTMKQSVVSVVDPDGATDLFERVLKFVRPSYTTESFI